MKKTAKILAALAALVAAPAAFAADAYIESDGTTGIDIGYRMNWNARVEVDFALTTTDQESGARLFGADYHHKKLGLAYSAYVTQPNSVFGGGRGWAYIVGDAVSYANPWPKTSSSEYIALDTARHTLVFDYTNRVCCFITGSTTNSTYQFAAKLTNRVEACAHPMSLFAVYSNQTASAFYRPIKARIYSVKIYEEGGLAHDYEPCVNNGVAGFIDVKDGDKFYFNEAAAENFSAGGSYTTISPSVNMTDTGKRQYIDTQYYATTNTRFELDYELTGLPASGRYYLFSGYEKDGTDNNEFGVWIKPDSSDYAYGEVCGRSAKTKHPAATHVAYAGALNDLRTVALDFFENKFQVIRGNATVYDQTAERTTNLTFTNNTIKVGSYATGTKQWGPIKVHGFRIFESGVKVRDFVPHWRNGKAGFVDQVTGIFVTYPGSNGHLETEGYIYQADDPYIETTELKQGYINTKYVPINTTRVELDYEMASDRPAGATWYLFGGRQNNYSFCACNNDKGFGFCNGEWHMEIAKDKLTSATTARRTAFIDNVAGKGGVVIGGVEYSKAGTTGQTASHSGYPILLCWPYNKEATRHASMRIFGFRIYEGGVLLHDYVPYLAEDPDTYYISGLIDRITGKILYVTGDDEVQDGGLYVHGGTFATTIENGPVVNCQKSGARLTAMHVYPTSYEWLLNGEPVEGATGSSLNIPWRSLSADEPPDQYQVVACYEYEDGTILKSEPSDPVEISYARPGVMMIFQ